MSLELQVHAQLLGLRVSDNHCECIMSAWLQERTTIAHPIWMLGYRHEPPTLHAQWVLGHWFQSHIDCYQGVLCYRDEPPKVYAPRVLRYRCEPPLPEAPWVFLLQAWTSQSTCSIRAGLQVSAHYSTCTMNPETAMSHHKFIHRKYWPIASQNTCTMSARLHPRTHDSICSMTSGL